ncbi:hypothetical protein AX15_000866 [Amanita polypyramis BW_CC]|nr:hypothetical protein AX15_000866 [Amanita polypyramis BW_CC]
MVVNLVCTGHNSCHHANLSSEFEIKFQLFVGHLTHRSLLMAAVPDEAQRRSDSWGIQDNQSMMPGSNSEPVNSASLPADDRVGQEHDTTEYSRGGTVEVSVSSNKADPYRGEKQVKPNKVYIGGLPEHTRQEDLQNCFGKIGKIVNIELKVGYGFVEFDNREAAEESVAKYHEGYFMGNKIRVELSRGGRTVKFNGDPGACFKCGDLGHWARECPNAPTTSHNRRPHHEPPLLDRIERDYTLNRNVPPARDDYSSTRYPPREVRYDYPPPPPSRESRRPPSPRDHREHPPAPSRARDYDDHRRGPPASDRERYGPPPASDYRGRYAPPPESPYRSYGAPPLQPPPPSYYDRRPNERHAAYPPSSGGRARTPPRVRDDYERDRYPPRDYHPEYRGRPPTPPPGRYPDYARSDHARSTVELPARYSRRRSESPPQRTTAAYDQGYTNSYSGRSPGQAHRNSGVRDYPPPRGGREPLDVNNGYRRP